MSLTPEIAYDPAYRDACDAAVWAVFKDITNDYVSTPEREAYIQRHCAGRSASNGTHPAAGGLVRREGCGASLRPRSDQPSATLRQRDTAPTQRELDELDDSAVDDLYHKSLRAHAQAVRRPNGVLA